MKFLFGSIVASLLLVGSFGDLTSCHSGTHKPCEEGFACKVPNDLLAAGIVGATGNCVVNDSCSDLIKCPFGYSCSDEGECIPPVNRIGAVCGTYANIGCQEGSSCVNNVCMPEVCTRPLKTGRCRAYFERWGFDAEKGECVKFVYGGCDANGNNFISKHACELRCPSSEFEVSMEEDVKCQPDVELCSDSGSFIGRHTKDCKFDFDHCPKVYICTMDVRQCEDGTFVGRIGPNCEFEPCPNGGQIKDDISMPMPIRNAIGDDDAQTADVNNSIDKEKGGMSAYALPISVISLCAAMLAGFLLIRWRRASVAGEPQHVEMEDDDDDSSLEETRA